VVAHGTAVLIVSALGSAVHVGQMIQAGVAGVVAKQDGLADLREAIDAALSGRAWMSPVLARAMASDDRIHPNLSTQELEALRLYACGLKLDTVARRMGVAPSTAKQYIDRVRKKYEEVGRSARTKSELYREGLRDGFIDPPS
jgi:DNA-binding NarL/FixJ family response regulator